MGVICVGFALLTLPHGERQRRVVLEVEEGNTGRDARIKQLEEEAKDKAIEAEVRKAAAQLEKDRAEKMKNRAMAEKTKDKALEDKRRAEEDFKRARDLAGQSARARADGKVAEQKVRFLILCMHCRSSVLFVRASCSQRRCRITGNWLKGEWLAPRLYVS